MFWELHIFCLKYVIELETELDYFRIYLNLLSQSSIYWCISPLFLYWQFWSLHWYLLVIFVTGTHFTIVHGGLVIWRKKLGDFGTKICYFIRKNMAENGPLAFRTVLYSNNPKITMTFTIFQQGTARGRRRLPFGLK